MSQIIEFPKARIPTPDDYSAFVENELSSVPVKDRPRLRFELLKAIDSYGPLFSQWPSTLTDVQDIELKKQLHQVANQEHRRKLSMLKDIIRLKVQVLVAQYHAK